MNVMRISEAAKMIGVHKDTMRAWCRAGVGPRFYTTPGGRRIFREEHVREFIASLENESIDKPAAA